MKSYKPTSIPRRAMTTIEFNKIVTVSEPEKSLTHGFRRAVGRNNRGIITTRHKGSGHKRLYREVDFTYNKRDIPAVLKTVEYDPNRTAFIALAQYKDGEKRYVVLPQGMKVGSEFVSSDKAEIKVGNSMMLRNIPVGTFVYNVEVIPKGGARMARGAGNFVEVIAHDAGYVHLKLPSTEVRRVVDTCFASIGVVSNEENRLINIGKAGRSRWLGIRPTVRGTAQNPVDHPYGGGEGRQGRGTRRAKSVYGKPTGKGQKSRRSKRYSNRLIVTRRRVGKAKKG
jgi:large subunit ribosomal protein L2